MEREVPTSAATLVKRAPQARRRATVSVCIPARNEEATIGGVVAEARSCMLGGRPLADEVIVMDHGSTDGTSEAARAAGATVVDADSFGWPEPAVGKGDVLWRSLMASTGDIVVWLDADLTGLDGSTVARLAAPLLTDPSAAMVKATHDRALDGRPGEGGRVTELTAKPLLASLFPHLAWMAQPLSGQCAMRREVAEQLMFEVDYGVEIGLLIDVAELCGVGAIREAALPPIDHRHRSLPELRAQAGEVVRAMLCRAGHRGLAAGALGRPPVAALRLPAA